MRLLGSVFNIKIPLCEVGKFCATAGQVSEAVTLSQNNSVVNAKSLGGVISLNLDDTIKLIAVDIPPQRTKEIFGKYIIENREN